MIRIISPGKTRNPHIRAIEDELVSRISRFHSIQLHYPEVKVKGEPRRVMEEEERAMRKYVRGMLVVLDVKGRMMDTEEFARWLERNIHREPSFVIGGPWGVSENLKRDAELLLSLSPMTFSHEMARIMLLEQIYRAFFPTFNK